MKKGYFFLIPILFLMIGAAAAVFAFFILWPVISLPLDPKGLANEIAWTLNYLISYFLLAFLVFWRFKKKDFPGWSIWLTLPALIPISLWLILFAGITDSPQKEYLPRIFWVLAPTLGYIAGIIFSVRYFISPKNYE